MPGKVGHDPSSPLWYNRSMTATRIRYGALLLALLFLMGAVAGSPVMRPVLRHFAFDLGLLHPVKQIELGERLSPLPLQGLDGSQAVLHDVASRGLLINVFTSWCPSCNEEMPALSKAAPALAREGIDVVGVDQGENGDTVNRFVQSYGVNFTVYIDPDSSTNGRLGARIIPTTLLVDRNGVVRYRHAGPLDSASFLALARAYTE